jgi:SHS2 domain-containing protein
MARLSVPQPYEELDHTADEGVIVRGSSAEETLARLLLALSQLLSGGGALAVARTARIEVEAGDRATMAIDLLRELLYRFDTEQVIAASCRVERFDPSAGAAIEVELAPYDAELHAEGIELKAITWHEARFEPEESGSWVAQVVFDV